jgi:hypothetical protein
MPPEKSLVTIIPSEWTIKTLKELYDERFKMKDENLVLQAREYERRLEALNGEGDRIKEVLKDSVPREVFDRTINSMNDKHAATINEMNGRFAALFSDLRKDIKDLADFKTKQEGKSQLTQFIPWIISAAALAYAILKK